MGSESGYIESPIKRAAVQSFAGGSTGLWNEGPRRKTTVSKGFYLSTTKIPVEAYCAFLNDVDDSHRFLKMNRWSRIVQENGRFVPREGAERTAVNTVPWFGAKQFCEWLIRKSEHAVRLPTEAEWELAAKGKEERKYPWGNGYDRTADYGWKYDENQPWRGAQVGSCPKNATPERIFDLIGIQGEWCEDWYSPKYDLTEKTDPTGPRSGEHKILRGRFGSTSRLPVAPDAPDPAGIYSFRVVIERIAPQPKQ
jgi:formylglycine-generating enzyme required for sulfatase activity